MRHLKAGKRLGVTTSHRKALMRNLVTSLLEHGEIKTTVTRAKEMRKYFDKMIGLGKRSDLHARRQALAFVKSKGVVKKLFDEYGPLYQDRNGGYTRIYRIGNRLGDNAQMALIQMVGLDDTEEAVEKPSSETITEVKEELQTEEKGKASADAAETVAEEAPETEATDAQETPSEDASEAERAEAQESETAEMKAQEPEAEEAQEPEVEVEKQSDEDQKPADKEESDT
ncbi:MAG: 50S ribosomal protein L17 [Proteobacteria bacterium]|nr:50S ribosomal protein L17 [Pseudomonadota bacterium]